MKVFTIFASVLALLVAVPMAGTLTAIHGIPGDSVDEALDRELAVDVYVNEAEEPAFSFEFGDVVADIDLPAGDYTITVCLAGTDTCVLEETATITEDGNFTAVAHLTYKGAEEAPGIALSFFENNLENIGPDDSRLILRHTANAPEVKLNIRRIFSGVRIPGFNNDAVSMEMEDGSETFMANPSEVVVDQFAGWTWVFILAGEDPVFSVGPLSQKKGKVYAAYAVGDFFKGSFDVVLQVVQ